ncbi:MAG TPA: murein biosynthesis integral membrane protein MurJ [Candidatus Omnitrophota bacterium]|nr:murein biosynthesis integral membrane protein MurJ [Candidatus Omnitrophota bacterium]
MAETEAKRVLMRSAGLIGFLTLVSRISGMVRDVVSARMFGTGRIWDAFLYAFMIPNFLRRLVGEGALANAFIPIYTQVLKEQGQEEADKIGNIVSTILLFGLGILSVIFLLAAHFSLLYLNLPEKMCLVIKFLKVLFPYVIFLAQVALFMGILHSHKKFLFPALSPVILNLAWILTVMAVCPFVGKTLEAKANALAVGIFLSGFLQVLLHFFPLSRIRYRFRMSFRFFHPAVKRIFKLILPSVMTFAVMQISLLIDSTLAFWVGDGANSALWYGNRLMQFPLALFGIALGTALLPAFSEHAVDKNHGAIRETLSFSLRMIFAIVIPASVGLIFLRTPVIQVLFERGKFDAVSTLRTANVVFCYTLGLFAFAGQKIFSSAFYGVQDTRTPFKISCIAIGCNIVLNLILMWPLREAGLALSTSLSGILSFFLLATRFERHVPGVGYGEVFRTFAKILSVSLLMGALSLWLYHHLHFGFLPPELGRIISLSCAIVVGIAGYAGVGLMVGIREIRDIPRNFI